MIRLIKKYWIAIIVVEIIAICIIECRTGVYTNFICKNIKNSGIGTS
jgi:hypothetical protein